MTPILVSAFEERIWNAAELGAASEPPRTDVSFQGSRGDDLPGRGTPG